jgi:adenine-specific DNA-methyltransferase
MEKLKLHTPDLTAQNIDKLAQLFPDCVTETRDEQGSVTQVIDFDQLRQELSGSVVEGPQERYHLDWPGKREAILAANAPIAKTLRPCREESVDFDTTKNIFIEGDNLDALKLLQETYLGKVRLIYIDPLYNTGSDLLYKDDFAEDSEAYFKRSNQMDPNGNRMVTNTEANGRFHSDWLSFIYPRIKLSRNLLTNDGIFLASINDIELQNLKSLCDEVFGFKNRLATFVWVNEGNIDNQSKIKTNHEYIVAYARDERSFLPPAVIDPNIPETSKLFKDFIENTIVKNGPANPVGDITLPPGFPADFDEGIVEPKADFWPKLSCPVTVSSGVTQNRVVLSSGWSSKELAQEFIAGNFQPIVDLKGQESRFFLSKTGALYVRKVRSDSQSHVLTVLRGMGTVQEASSELAEMGITFSYPKPVSLIEYLVRVGSSDCDIIMDLFAGSGTLGEAIFRLNSKAGKRRFVLVQIPEELDVASEKGGVSQKTVAEIGKERLRKVGAKIKSDTSLTAPNLDTGFRVLKINTSNMREVYYAPDAVAQVDLLGQVDNIRPDRTPEDLIFQVLVDWGLDLALPIVEETIGEKTVFFVDSNALAACFDFGITDELVKEIAKRKPLRAVFRDASYGSDSVKINVDQIFRLLSPDTEVRSI